MSQLSRVSKYFLKGDHTFHCQSSQAEGTLGCPRSEFIMTAVIFGVPGTLGQNS
jgi:hypothetical protein